MQPQGAAPQLIALCVFYDIQYMFYALKRVQYITISNETPIT